MGRPVEVDDERVIAAGLRLESRGVEIKATRLWTELEERGRPKRMMAVWNEHVADRASHVEATTAATPLLPERAPRLADGFKSQLGAEHDRTVRAIYDEVQTTVTSRFQDEFAAMEAARAAHVSEIDEALDAIGRLGEQRDALQATQRQAEQEAAATRRECSIKDKLLEIAALERTALKDLAAALGETVESERSTNADLRAALMRAEITTETSASGVALLREALRTKPKKTPRSGGHLGLRPAKPMQPLSKLVRRGAHGTEEIASPSGPAQDGAYENRPECLS